MVSSRARTHAHTGSLKTFCRKTQAVRVRVASIVALCCVVVFSPGPCVVIRLRGGWAQVQLEFLQSFLTSTLGYVPLHNVVQPKPKEVTSRVFFGKDQTLPYAADWSAIFVKPIAKVNAQGDCAKKLQAAATTAA